jgi:hypothetical protein
MTKILVSESKTPKIKFYFLGYLLGFDHIYETRCEVDGFLSQ